MFELLLAQLSSYGLDPREWRIVIDSTAPYVRLVHLQDENFEIHADLKREASSWRLGSLRLVSL